MPLITCTDCGASVSDRAPTCPNCGAPIAAQPAPVASAIPVATIELTSKRLKRQLLLSALCIVVGLVWLISASAALGSGSGGAGGPIIGSLLMVGGVAWFIATRVRIWWHHR